MNSPVESHEPTPEFRAHLEWQIETALRRETRLATPVTGARWLGAALVVVAALATGGVAGLAAGHVQDARQRDRLIETVRSEESVLQLRLELAESEYQESRKRFEAGTVGRESVLAAESQVLAMRKAIARIQLDIEEIRATSATPRNDLDAPLVGGRDFVRDRLTVDLQSAQQALSAAEQAAEQATGRFKVGVAPRATELQAQEDVAQARARIELLMANLDLRQRYLRGELKADALASMARRRELTLQLQRGQRELELLRARLDDLRRRLAIGQASELELKQSEVDLLERQVEIKRIQQELDALSAVKR